MRKIKKEIAVQEFACVVYDRKAKEEKTMLITAIGGAEITPPENCVILEAVPQEEKTVKYVMSAEDFIRYAKPETK